MGQKVNSISFRLANKKNWKSRWFSKKSYSNFVLEDFKIRENIKSQYPLATISEIKISRKRGGDISINIYTPKPGILIGRSGKGIEELKNFTEKLISKKVKIEIFEVSNPDTVAQLVAENISWQIEKRIAYKRAVKVAIDRAKKAGVTGIRVIVAGRLGGADIARKETFGSGSIPSQTLRANVQFAKVDSKTKFGIIGIKVWIYKKPKE